MPRPGPLRPSHTFRLDPGQWEWLAAEEQRRNAARQDKNGNSWGAPVSKSQIIRELIDKEANR